MDTTFLKTVRGRRRALLALAAAAGVWLAGPAPAAWAYIDYPAETLTLPRLMLELRSAGLFEVERVDLEKGAIRFKPLEHIQGNAHNDGINHLILYSGKIPPELQNVKVGQKAVLFYDDPYNRAVTFLEGAWYCSGWDAKTGWARIAYTAATHDFNCCFCGTVSELVAACKAIVRGETAVVRCRVRPNAPETQWVSVNLRDPHRKPVAPAPAGAPAAGPPKPAPAAADALPALLEKLRAEKPAARMEAAEAIGRLGPQAKGAAAALVAAFPQEKDPFARRAMITALGAIGPDAREAAPALALAVRNGYSGVDDLVGFEASAALGRIDSDGALSRQVVVAMLQDKDPDVRSRAAGMVRVLHPDMKSTIPALVAATKDASLAVRIEAMRSLAALRPEASVVMPALMAGLRDSDKYMRFYAANGLADYAADAKDAIKPLIEAVAKEKEPDARAREIRALRYLGPAAAEAVPMLTELLKDPNKEVQAQAEKALKKIRPEPPKPNAPRPKPGPAAGKPGG
jgi:HEAT repeat protein